MSESATTKEDPPDDETPPSPIFAPPGAGTPVGVTGGLCANCGGLISYDYDTSCCIIIILLSVFCFPFGLISLCWMKRRPSCAQCGSAGI